MRGTCAVLVALGLAGCVATTGETVRFTPAPHQHALMRDGYPVLASKLKRTWVALAPTQRQFRSGKQVAFLVKVQNVGKAPVDLWVHNITVVQKRGGNAVAAAPVKTYEQVMDEQRQRETVTRIVAAALGSASVAVASSAGVSTRSAERDMRSTDAKLARQGQRILDTIERTALKDHTLLPGEAHEGFVAFDVPEPESGARAYAVRIELGGEVHAFEVTQGGG